MAIAYLGYKVDSAQVEKAEKRLDKMSGAAGVAGKAVAKLAVAAGAMLAGGQVIRELSQFGTSMSRVQAITGATEAELRRLRDTAKQLGSSTEFSASQAADGLQFLGMAGFSAAESIAAIPAVLDLATASGLGLASSADIASNVLSGFGKSADEAANVADILAAASSRANTDVAQLGQAMSTVAPISKSLGVSIEDTASAIGIMSDAGIQGSRAGTALRGTLAALSGVSTEGAKALAEYGLAVSDVSIETHGLAGVLETLEAANLSTADAMTIFGREAASGALTLIDASKRVGEFGEELGRVDGEAQKMASTMRDNLGGDIQGLISAVSGLILAIGDAGLTAALRGVVGAVTAVVRAVSGLVEWLSQMQGYVIAAAGVMTAIYYPALVSAATAMWGMVSANAVLIASMVTLRGVLLTAGIGAVVVGFGFLINEVIRASSAVGGFANLMARAGEVFGLSVRGMITAAKAIPLMWKSITSTMLAGWLKMVLEIQRAWAAMLRDMAKALSYMPGMENAFNKVGNAAIMAGTKVHEIELAINNAQGAAQNFAETAGSSLANAFNPALTKASQLLALIRGAANMSTSSAPDDGSRGGQVQNTPIVSIPSVIIPSVNVGGGGGGGGSLAPLADTSAFDALRERLMTEAEIVDEWRAEAIEATNAAREQEVISQQEHNQYMLDIERLYQEQLNELRRQKRDEDLGHYQSFFSQMASALQAGGSKMLKISKAFALAEAAVSIWRGAAKALELPFPANLSAWATVLATGAKAIAGIRGASAGSAGTVGGASAASASTQPQTPQRTLRIEVEGEGMFADMLRDNVDQIADAIIGNSNSGGAPIMVSR